MSEEEGVHIHVDLPFEQRGGTSTVPIEVAIIKQKPDLLIDINILCLVDTFKMSFQDIIAFLNYYHVTT